jgi:divalent metal cation (Fe/Co/Zn/Cd) transporter
VTDEPCSELMLSPTTLVGATLGSLAGWQVADPVIGLTISFAIIRVLRVAARDVFRRILDVIEPHLVDTVSDQLAAVPGIRAVDRVQMRWVGHQLHVDADVALDAHLALARAHDILEEARPSLLHYVPRLADALLPASPLSDGYLDPHSRTQHHFATR